MYRSSLVLYTFSGTACEADLTLRFNRIMILLNRQGVYKFSKDQSIEVAQLNIFIYIQI